MATKVIAGKTVQINEEGYMTNPDEWTREIAECIAIEEGIPELTAEHWKVIEYCRKTAAENGGKLADPAHHHHERGRNDQRIVQPVPQGTCQENRQDRRAKETRRLRLRLVQPAHFGPVDGADEPIG